MLRSSYGFLFLTLLTISAFITTDANAQMFSADEKQNSTVYIPQNEAGPGLEFINYSYNGDGGQGLYEFSDPLYSVFASLSGLDVQFGFSLNAGDGDSTRVIFGKFEFGGRFVFVRKKNFTAGIPFVLITETMNIRRDSGFLSGNTTFEQSAFMAGTGGFAEVKFNPSWRFSTDVTMSYGYATHAYGSSVGQKWRLLVKNRLAAFRISERLQLYTGYDFKISDVNLDGETYDYGAVSHSVSLGIRF